MSGFQTIGFNFLHNAWELVHHVLLPLLPLDFISSHDWICPCGCVIPSKLVDIVSLGNHHLLHFNHLIEITKGLSKPLDPSVWALPSFIYQQGLPTKNHFSTPCVALNQQHFLAEQKKILSPNQYQNLCSQVNRIPSSTYTNLVAVLQKHLQAQIDHGCFRPDLFDELAQLKVMAVFNNFLGQKHQILMIPKCTGDVSVDGYTLVKVTPDQIYNAANVVMKNLHLNYTIQEWYREDMQHHVLDKFDRWLKHHGYETDPNLSA